METIYQILDSFGAIHRYRQKPLNITQKRLLCCDRGELGGYERYMLMRPHYFKQLSGKEATKENIKQFYERIVNERNSLHSGAISGQDNFSCVTKHISSVERGLPVVAERLFGYMSAYQLTVNE
jgi:hypothetical protein